jgi:hypothetical protein
MHLFFIYLFKYSSVIKHQITSQCLTYNNTYFSNKYAYLEDQISFQQKTTFLQKILMHKKHRIFIPVRHVPA